jgi:hypothetical protein
VSACGKPGPAPRVDQETASQAVAPAEAEAPAPATSEPIKIPPEAIDEDRWLYVLKVRDGEPGAWATGSFDPERNKIDIHTNAATVFAIDVSRMPIDWEKLVIIGIDGVNSELRKRDYFVLQFALDEQKQWVVVEP